MLFKAKNGQPRLLIKMRQATDSIVKGKLIKGIRNKGRLPEMLLSVSINGLKNLSIISNISLHRTPWREAVTTSNMFTKI